MNGETIRIDYENHFLDPCNKYTHILKKDWAIDLFA